MHKENTASHFLLQRGRTSTFLGREKSNPPWKVRTFLALEMERDRSSVPFPGASNVRTFYGGFDFRL